MCVCVCVCVCVFGIIRIEGGRASCQLSVDGRNIIKIIMLLLCMICPTPCIVPHLINVHMHVLMDSTKLTYLRLQGIARLPPPFLWKDRSIVSMLTNYKTQVHWGAGCLALRTRNGRLKNSFSPGGTLPIHPRIVDM